MSDRYKRWIEVEIEKEKEETESKRIQDQSRKSQKYDLRTMIEPQLGETLKNRLVSIGKSVSDFEVTGFAIGINYRHNIIMAKAIFTADCCDWKVSMTYPFDAFLKGVEWIPHDVFEKGAIEFVGFVDDFLQADNHKEKIKGE